MCADLNVVGGLLFQAVLIVSVIDIVPNLTKVLAVNPVPEPMRFFLPS